MAGMPLRGFPAFLLLWLAASLRHNNAAFVFFAGTLVRN